MSLEEMLDERAKRCDIFSNPIRSLIALTIHQIKEASWAEIKNNIEKITGPINPNTLSFHLTRLIESKLVKKIGTTEQPRYVSTDKNDEEILVKLGSELIVILQERLDN